MIKLLSFPDTSNPPHNPLSIHQHPELIESNWWARHGNDGKLMIQLSGRFRFLPPQVLLMPAQIGRKGGVFFKKNHMEIKNDPRDIWRFGLTLEYMPPPTTYDLIRGGAPSRFNLSPLPIHPSRHLPTFTVYIWYLLSEQRFLIEYP